MQLPVRLVTSRRLKVLAGRISRHIGTRALAATGLLGLVIGLMVVSVWPNGPAVAAVGINKQINFQGKVVNANGTNVADGSYSFTFRLYTVSSGGSHVWTETKTLAVADGIFVTALGDATGLPGSVDFNTDNIYLGINFNSDGEMTPRIRFTAAPYAFNSDLLDGLDSGSFAQLNPSSAQSGSLNVTGSVQAATSLQAPLVDTASAVALNVGTATASSVTVGRATSSTNLTLQGSASTTWSATGASGSTTVGFVAPTGTNAISFPDAGGTLCTTVAATCSATYQVASATGYLFKNAQDTSTASVTGALLAFRNTSSSGNRVLDLTNDGTGSTLNVVANANAGAGAALIKVNNQAGSPSGNLMELQTGGASRFTVSSAGTATFTGGVTDITTGTNEDLTIVANGTGTIMLNDATQVTADHNLTMASGTGVFSQTFTGTVDAHTITANSLAAGAALKVTSGNNSNANTAWSAVSFNPTNAQAGTAVSTGMIAGLDVQFTQNPTVNGNSETVGSLTVKQNDTSTADNTVSSLLHLANNDTATGNQITVADGIRINGANVTNGINLSGTFNGSLITATNFSVSQAGAIVGVGVNSGSGLIQGTGGLTVTGATSINNNNNGNTDINTGTSTGTVTIGGGSAPLVINSTNFDVSSAGALSGITTIGLSGTISGGTTYSASTAVTAPLHTSADGASSANVVLRSGNASGGNSGNVTVDAGTATGTTGAVNIATGNASALTMGQTDIAFLLQGDQTSTMTSTNSVTGFKTTVGFVPTTGADKAINFPNEGGIVCIQGSASCGFATGTFLAKNAQDTSTANVAGTLYAFSNTNTGSASVLSLTNAGTGSALNVSQSANPGSGSALILANNTAGSPSGNLLDLQVGGSSRFAVTSAGAVTTSSTINGQTISSSANFTGTVTTASTLTVSAGGLSVTGNSTITGTLGGLTGLTVVSGGANIDGGINNNNDGITNTGAIAGATTIGASGQISTSANTTGLAVTGTPAVSATSSLIQVGSAIAGGNAVANGGTYIGLNAPSSGAGSAADFLNFQVGGTSEFRVENDGDMTAGTLNGQTISSAANFTGTVTTANTLTVSAGGLSVTGNSTITGTLGGLTGLTVASGGASISGGLNNNSGGISGAGAIAGATNIGLNGTISGGTTYSASSSMQAPTFDANGAVGLNIGTANATSLTMGQTDIAFLLQGDQNSTITSTSSVTGFKTTLEFAPTTTADKTITFPDESGVVCMRNSANCGFLTSGGSFLAKNQSASETSSGSVAGAFYDFTNTNTGSSANVLTLSNSGTGSALRVTSAVNPAAGNALIFASNTNASPSGNLLDLQAGSSPTSRFSVAASGSMTSAGSLTVNGTSANTFGGQLVVSNVATDITTGTNEALTLEANGTGQVVLNDLVQTPTLGTADTSTLLCRNSSNQIATCSASLTGSAFVQGGNDFNATAVLGTNDADDLEFETNGVTRVSIGAAGGLTVVTGGANITGGIDNNSGGITEAGAVSGVTTIAQANSSASGTNYTNATTNSGASGTNTVVAQAINLTGTNNGAGANTTTGLAFGNVAAATNNTFYGIQFGTGFNDLIRYNGTQILSGAGKLQNAGLDSTITYSNITGVGALVNGSIASGFGTIATGNTITGTTLNGTTGVNTGGGAGTQRIDNSGNLLNIGTIAAGGTITVSGAATDLTTGSNEDLTLVANGTGQIVLNDTTQIPTLGATDTASLLCRNSSNQIAACSASLTGSAFVQGGNDFNATAVLGTNDADDLELETNGSTRLTIAAAGGVTLATGNSLTFQGGVSNFDQSASSGTFATGTGAVSLNGATTVAANRNLSMSSGTGVFSQTYTGGVDAHTITANSLTTGAALKVTSASNSGANAAWNGVSLNVTNSQATTAVSTGQITGLDLQFTQNTAVAGNTETAANFAIAVNNSSSSDALVNSIVSLANNDTATGNQIVASNGLLINGAGVTNGINLSGTFGTNLITSSNFTVTQGGGMTTAGNMTVQGTGTNTLSGSVTFSGVATDITTASNEDLTLVAAGTGQIVLNDTTQIPTLGATDTASLLCRNSSNQIAACSASLTGSAFVQGGNDFNATAVLGTNDSDALEIETNGTTRLTVGASGGVTLEANNSLTMASGTGAFGQTYTGTTGNAHSITANSLSTGTAFRVTSANNSAANTSWSAVMLDVSNLQATTAVSGANLIAGMDLQFTQNASVAGNNETVANLAVKAMATSVTDNSVASILNLANNDDATGNQITVADALKINGAGVTNGINLSGTFGTNLITSTNFSVSQGGAITGVGVNSGSGLIQGTGGLTVTGATSINNNNNGNTDINTGTSTGTVTIGGGSAPLVINSTNFDVSSAGALSGITTITTSSTINTNTFTGTALTFGSAAQATISAQSSQTLQVGATGNANTLALRGSASSTLLVSNGTNTTQIGFANPTANVVYNFGTAPASTYTICTTYVSSCSATYAPAQDGTGYIQNDTAVQTSANFNIDGQGRIGTNLTLGGDSSGTAFGSGADLMFGNSADRVIRVLAAASGSAGRRLTVQAGNGTGTNQAGGELLLQGGAATGSGAGGVVTVRSQTNSTTAFTVQNSSSTAVFTVDTSSGSGAGTVVIGDGTNGATFGTTREVTYSGTARHSKTVKLTAEYGGAVLDADGSNNTGTMTAAWDATQRTGYYRWTTGQASNQDYDVVVNVPVPEDWAAWNGNPTMEIYESNASGSFTVTITRTDGTTDTNWNALTVNPAGAGSWTTYNSTGLQSTGYSAGGVMTIRVKMTAPPNQHMRLGTITLPYFSKW